MDLSQGIFRSYGSQICFAADDAGGGGSGSGDQTDWKAKFDGLNGQIASGQYVTQASYVTLQRNLETAVSERKTAQGELGTAQAKISLLSDTQEALQGKLTGLETEKAKLAGDVGARDAQLNRHNVIFKQFPGLAPFEADGLLPVPSGDKTLEDVLTAFQTKIAGISDQARTDYRKGDQGTPPAKAAGDEGKVSKTLLGEANTLLGQGKLVEYNQKMDAYQAAKTKESQP